MKDQDRFLRLPQVAEALGCGKSTVWKWVKDGRIPEPKKMGRITVWRESEIQKIIAGELS